MIQYEPFNDNIESPYAIYTVENLNWNLHFHRALECILVLSGEISCVLDGNEYLVTVGKGIFIMPNQPHSIYTGTHSKIMIARFYPELVTLFFSQYHNQAPAMPLFTFTHIDWQKMLNESNFYHTTGYLYQLCGCITEQTNFLPREENDNPLIHKVFHYVEEHYLQNCSLKDISGSLGYESSYLSKTFKKYANISYTNYVNHRKIAHACILIMETDLPFIEIASMCGFDSLRSFNRNFAKVRGCTPTEYRNHSTFTPRG